MEIEKILGERDLIVSSTDKRGIINYVNATFEEISEYTKDELYGQPHNMIRHPDMPKAIFKYIWTSLLSYKPVVGYVKNYIKGNTSYYWVKAVMYPKIVNNEIDTITSYRTKATSFEIEQIKEVYKHLQNYEKHHSAEESYSYFLNLLEERNLTYDKMINRLNDNQQILNSTLLQLDLQKYRTDYMILRSRIESLVEKRYENIDVTKAHNSDFGKRLALLNGEEFSKDARFLDAKRIHEKIHNELQLFVNSKELNERNTYMDIVYKDIDELFIVMEELKNEHKNTKKMI